MRTRKSNEVEAMGVIDFSLGALDEATRQRVLGWVVAKYLGSRRTAGASGAIWAQPTQSSATESIVSFLAAKKPESFYERVACLAYFLEKIEGRVDMTTLDITRANAEAHLSVMPKSAFVYHAASSYGYLTRVGRGRLTISKRGEALVEALPDRGRAKLALEQHPFRRPVA